MVNESFTAFAYKTNDKTKKAVKILREKIHALKVETKYQSVFVFKVSSFGEDLEVVLHQILHNLPHW